MTSDLTEMLAALGMALAAGFVVGAEREQRSEQSMFGGARTFPLYALIGAIGMLLGTWIAFVLALCVGGLIAVAYYRDTAEGGGMGMSTEVAAVATFALGALCTADHLPVSFADRLLVVAAGAVATVTLLSIKKPLHGVIERVSKEDVYATTKLLLLLVIVLPLLPNEDLGPWGALNPWQIGLLVVLISGIGFAGYVAIRALGAHRGLGVTGLLGGLASSVAVTLSFSGRAKEHPELRAACAVAIVLASSVMFPRMIVEAYAVSPPLGRATLWPFVAALSAGLLSGWGLHVQSRDGAKKKSTDTESPTEPIFHNPFSIGQALKFAVMFSVVLVLARAAQHYLQNPGVYLASLVSGVANVDAITLSLARLHAQGNLDTPMAVDAIGVAALTNTFSKATIAAFLGGARLGLIVAAAMSVAVGAGVIVRLILLA